MSKKSRNKKSRSWETRRRVRAINPLAEFQRNEECWCQSGKKYKNCHLVRDLSGAGALTPPDAEDSVFISPTTAIRLDAFNSDTSSVPITTQYPTPQAVPVNVEESIKSLASMEVQLPPPSHSEIGQLRYALLDQAGISDSDRVRSGDLDAELEQILPDIASGALELARFTMHRNLIDKTLDSPPVVLNSDLPNVTRLVGQTLLWADHYLVPDRIADKAAAGHGSLELYRHSIADMIDLRPLIESGVVVPVMTDLAISLMQIVIDELVAEDLNYHQYVDWVSEQVIIEGPTAREAAFIHVVDDYRNSNWFYLYSRTTAGLDDEGSKILENRMLNLFDPQYDYGPWLSTVKRQAVAELTKKLNISVAAATTMGADFITGSPFRARALRRRGRGSTDPRQADISGAVWADVPWLPDASPEVLLKIARNEDRVHDLRWNTAKALRAVESGDLVDNAQAITDLSADLDVAASRLGRDLRNKAVFDVATSGGLAIGSVLVAATFGPPVLLGGLLASAASTLPGLAALLRDRRSAAYAFWMARSRAT